MSKANVYHGPRDNLRYTLQDPFDGYANLLAEILRPVDEPKNVQAFRVAWVRERYLQMVDNWLKSI